MTPTRRAILAAISVPCLWFGASALEDAHARQLDSGPRWFKGNTHTHTLNSDGDSSPDEVARWYREHGYDFLVLTDHNVLTSMDGLNALRGGDRRFMVIRGEEVTDRFGDKPLHINGLLVTRVVPPQGGSSVLSTLQRNVDAIRAAGGTPSVNHPNFGWAITAHELASLRNLRFFEVFNGHPLTNNWGGGGTPGLEAVWDTILSRGVLMYGVAVDDAHHFKRPWDPEASKPGQGWIHVRASRLDPQELLRAMDRGDFYSSTGVELSDIQSGSQSLTVTVKERTWARYRIQFIGRGGRLLRETTVSPARYDFNGTEGYVRAKVLESSGAIAWTQPVSATRVIRRP